MTPGQKNDPPNGGPGAPGPLERSVSGTMPRIRPLTGGGAVVGHVTRPPTSTRSVGDQASGARRAVVRAQYAALVRVVSGPRTFDGRIDEVSESDMIIVVAPGLSEGERINARFALPMSNKVVSVPAAVAAREPGRPGGQEAVTLSFSIVDEAFRKELEGYVRLMHR